MQELTTEDLEITRGGIDIGGLLNSAFSMAQQAGAPPQQLGQAQQVAGQVMPMIQKLIGGQ
jgi:hypothetical protein